jgi:hypothetical protein
LFRSLPLKKLLDQPPTQRMIANRIQFLRRLLAVAEAMRPRERQF